jgi:septal ring factor EnvC (AmiA/AmiB activator)
MLLFLAGTALLIVFSLTGSLVQLTVPDELRGRVMSIYLTAFRGGLPLGSLVSGALTRYAPAETIVAANAGRVIWADYLGIYGNCVIVDHGLGLQSLYAHLSSIGVGVGDVVALGDELGRSGMTGLAGGDHLHFTMLLHGEPVTPVEWWDPHWIEDRVDRKLRDAS